MNEQMRSLAESLRTKSSVDAADWLLANYPDGGDGIRLLDHVSLNRADNLRLAKQYLTSTAFAHSWPYRVFGKRLGIRSLVDHLSAIKNRSAQDVELLSYHLESLVSKVNDDADRRALAEFVSALNVD